MEERFNPKNHLIMIKAKGGKQKEYLQVQWRLVWFRQDHPDWCINTQMLSYDAAERHAIFKAEILDADGVMKAAATGSESANDFLDFVEKAETKAVGRALAILGYGTQFVGDELDEGNRLMDAPVERPSVEQKISLVCADCGGEIKGGNVGGVRKSAEEVAAMTLSSFGRCLCGKCASKQ